jgi:hypothetical protein
VKTVTHSLSEEELDQAAEKLFANTEFDAGGCWTGCVATSTGGWHERLRKDF